MDGQYELKDGATKKYYSIAGMTVAMQDASGLQYLLTDHPSTSSGRRLGSTVAVTDSSGTLTSQQRYLPFGGVRSIPNSPILSTDFGYTGQRLLDAGMGGIMDYKARFYSPYINRFLQPDSIIPDQSNPQSWNRLSYVSNNPVRYNDPSGHKVCDGAGTNGGCDQSGIPSTLSQIRITLRSYGVKMTGKWSDENAYAAYLGVATVGDKLARSSAGSAENAFKAVFGSVTFQWMGGVWRKD